ncbi:MAG: ParA family protein [Gammaproteobacteria bacterium]|nr:ParA family protein [Gammaproteobacteria bacterium]
MAKVLSITNQKGGVGKTTTAINMAASLSRMKQKILLIDIDPQGNASAGSGVDRDSQEVTAYEVLMHAAPIQEAIVATNASYDVVASNRELSGALIELVDEEHREFRLRVALQTLREEYDFVLIDCPPSLDLLTVNALVASDAVVIPMQCEYFALEGLTELVNTIRKIRAAFNPDLNIEGLLRTMFDSRNSLSREVSSQLEEYFGDKVYHTIIPRNIRLAEAPSYGKPVLEYDKRSKGARAYLALAGEVMGRESNK